MLNPCQDCLGGQRAKSEALRAQLARQNERERKRLVMDLEEAGISLPVTELETMLNVNSLMDNDYEDQSVQTEDDGTKAAGNVSSRRSGSEEQAHSAYNLTKEDYVTQMPNDLKDILRKQYSKDPNHEGSIRTTPESDGGEDDDEEDFHSRSFFGRIPFWFFRRNGVVMAETEQGSVEMQPHPRSAKHTMIPGHGSAKRVTVLYPKERTRHLRIILVLCCLLQFVGLFVFVGILRARSEQASSDNSREGIVDDNIFAITEAPRTEVPILGCVERVTVNKRCFVRGEPILISFQNCEPAGSDWLAIYSSDQDSMNLDGDPVSWMYSCGNKQCRGIVQSSVYQFQLFKPGTYRSHLIGGSSDVPYLAQASSAVFEVKNNRLDCPSPIP